MKGLATVFALTTLAAGSMALGQQSSPSSSTPPPSSTSSSTSQDPSASTSSTSDKQALMKKCVTQVQAANPTAPMKDIQAYCDKEVKSYSTESAPRN
jgi:hypothetical protein